MFADITDLEYDETAASVGARVRICSTGELGMVAFRGPTQFAPGSWYGIRLDRAVGKNSGVVQGVLYFHAGPKRGFFLESFCLYFTVFADHQKPNAQ